MPRFDKNEALKNIISSSSSAPVEGKKEETKLEEKEQEQVKKTLTKAAPTKKVEVNPVKGVVQEEKVEYVQLGIYITPEQKRKLKIRAATSEKLEEKNISAIVRNAIDDYLK